jgi:membrane-associated HD superfamily phosphohydrolase
MNDSSYDNILKNNLVNLQKYNLVNEGVFFQVLSSSLLLLTVSLVFFHMTKRRTVEMKRYFAKFFCIVFILLSITYLIQGLIKYHNAREMNNQSWDLYLVTGIIFILLEIGIAFIMIEIFDSPLSEMTTMLGKKSKK